MSDVLLALRCVSETDRKLLVLAWTGPLGIGLVLVGWMALAGFLPPPRPNLSVNEVADLWREHTNLKRLGMVMCVWGGSLYVPFTIAVALMLRRIERDRIFATAQAALGTFGTVFFTLNFLILAIVAFRPARPSEVTQALHDVGFIMTFSPVAPFTFQYLLIGAAILRDRSADRVFPRWTGYANLWIGFLLVPACLIPFFKTGPLAWNGVLSFWIPVFVFVAWFVVMFWCIRRALTGPAGSSDRAAG
jgi:hypothetical protein